MYVHNKINERDLLSINYITLYKFSAQCKLCRKPISLNLQQMIQKVNSD